MRLFVGYGYNQRDAWIKKDVYPILKALNMTVVDGADMHGEKLDQGVAARLDQSDAMVGFFTLREVQEEAEFNTHIWVRDEMNRALTQQKPVIEVREAGVNNPPGLNGERQRIDLRPDDRLAAISELVSAIARWSLKQLTIVPLSRSDHREIFAAWKSRDLKVRYRTRLAGIDSDFRDARLQRIDGRFRLDVLGVAEGSYIQIEFHPKNGNLIDTGWVSADLIRIEFGESEE